MAALLALARDGSKHERKSDLSEDDWVEIKDSRECDDCCDLEKLKLWVEIKKQVEILRRGMDDDDGKGDA